MQLCNIVTLCFSHVNCIPPPDGSIRYWLPPSPPLSMLVAELLRLDSWYFGLCPGLGVYSSLPITFFCFLPLHFFLVVFCLCLSMCVSPTVSLAQSTRDDLPVILYKVLESSPYVTIQLGHCQSTTPNVGIAGLPVYTHTHSPLARLSLIE
jgi:hypothetical protein